MMDSSPAPPDAPSASAIPAEQPALPVRTGSTAAPEQFGQIDDYLGAPPRRRLLPLVLFLATCFFTYAAGAYNWQPLVFGMDPAHGERWDFSQAWLQLQNHWQDGLIYMGCVMAILVAHEMGHFLMTVRYRVPASYPIFLPLPIMLTGTMGAVIGMEGFRANRRQMFDIGLAGPLAGLVLTIPMVWIGIKIGHASPPQSGSMMFADPLLAKLLMHWLRPDFAPNTELVVNPVYMAGWVGMFVTGLNMMPVSQLDGGHVIYALFLKRGHWIARAFLLTAMAFVVFSGQYSWTLMLVLVTLIGVDHPPTSDDTVPLGVTRTILGTLSLALPILCFTPIRLVTG
jgi:Zn-dependent protease